MNKKLKIALITLAVTVVLVVAAVLIATLIKPSPEAEPYALPSAGSSDNIVTETPSDEPEPSASPEHVNTVTSTLAVGGDIVMHTGLNGEAMTDSGYDYVPIFGIIFFPRRHYNGLDPDLLRPVIRLPRASPVVSVHRLDSQTTR